MGTPKCFMCKNFIGINENGDRICKAFPEGIPRYSFDKKTSCNNGLHFEMNENYFETETEDDE